MAKSTKNKAVASPVYVPSRKIDDWVRTSLYTRAGGRCEFDGCGRYLLHHHVTFTSGNFAQLAHIVAFSVDGPRGFEIRPDDIHDESNLMLLCPTCHKLIDDNPDTYSRATLETYKKSHEQQIFHLTGLRPEMKTSVLVVKSKVGDQTVAIPSDHIMEAIAPRYPVSKDEYVIDLTPLTTKSAAFITAACASIEEELARFTHVGDVKKSNHVSLFAIAPIPVLMFLGSKLGNKVPLDLFQRHRDDERWKWKGPGATAQYELKKLREGSEADKAALLLSLSGTLRTEALPTEIDGRYSVYELTLCGVAPDPTFLRTNADLEEFRSSYQHALAIVARECPGIQAIDFFPAVPAPVAVLCGRECLPKAHPALRVYDYDKSREGFTYSLTINQ